MPQSHDNRPFQITTNPMVDQWAEFQGLDFNHKSTCSTSPNAPPPKPNIVNNFDFIQLDALIHHGTMISPT